MCDVRGKIHVEARPHASIHPRRGEPNRAMTCEHQARKSVNGRIFCAKKIWILVQQTVSRALRSASRGDVKLGKLTPQRAERDECSACDKITESSVARRAGQRVSGFS